MTESMNELIDWEGLAFESSVASRHGYEFSADAISSASSAFSSSV